MTIVMKVVVMYEEESNENNETMKKIKETIEMTMIISK